MSTHVCAILTLCAIAISGCAAGTSPLPSDVGHPASPNADAAPAGAPLARLAPDEFDRPFVGPAPGAARDSSAPLSGAARDSMTMHHDHGMTMGRVSKPPATAALSRRDTTHVTSPDAAAAFVCPMHPEVTDSVGSKCPKCGMTLIRRKDRP